MNRLKSAALAAVALCVGIAPTLAQEVTLRVHHFLPAPAPVPKNFITPWAEKVMKVRRAHQGRVYPSMQLGGGPPALFDQARDGVVDIVWTLPGYTPGRFPGTEAFELPFMPAKAEATSQAFWDFYESTSPRNSRTCIRSRCMCTGRASCTSRARAWRSEDMKGLKLRGPTRQTNALLSALGANAGRHAGSGHARALSRA
ncbi:MAG: hypothetical protein HPM95_05105 [Alphaproteobacteria bacterium]|nr:hypothetical protein [Alphaproteobacteria bacterium]